MLSFPKRLKMWCDAVGKKEVRKTVERETGLEPVTFSPIHVPWVPGRLTQTRPMVPFAIRNTPSIVKDPMVIARLCLASQD